jgi:K+/H+ antiporter YhaU regulatory subunit KhtT
VVQLTEDEAEALADVLGGDRIAGHLAALQQQVEGLAIDWLPIGPGSPFAHGTIADTQARSRTGVSIVAVLRDGTAFPAPAPGFRFEPGDTAVVVGTQVQQSTYQGRDASGRFRVTQVAVRQRGGWTIPCGRVPTARRPARRRPTDLATLACA